MYLVARSRKEQKGGATHNPFYYFKRKKIDLDLFILLLRFSDRHGKDSLSAVISPPHPTRLLMREILVGNDGRK